MKTILKHWHWLLAGCIILGEAIILLLLNEDIYVGICDNLDLFITQLKMLSDNNAFFAHGKVMPVLKGIDRDYFPTEFSLYNLLYMILPDIYAYIAGYVLKMVISLFSALLLAKYLLKDRYAEYERIVVLVSCAFALLPLYPMYSICFASLPLVGYLLVRIHKQSKLWLYVALFCYPFLSYFTFFGAFILGYILIAAVILGVKQKKFPKALVISFFVLMAGYACFEYRLFGVMLFSEEETIRSTMLIASFGVKELVHTFADVFVNGFSHAKSVHRILVLPVCAVYFVWNNYKYIKNKEYKRAVTDIFNITVVFIVFNCAVYALYFWEPLRRLVENLLPPLKGFQYGRTIFFNTFAWYFAFCIVLIKLYKTRQKVACVLAVMAIVVVGTAQCEYSDFYNTVYCHLYKSLKHTKVNQLSYGEFFAEPIFDEIKKDIDYEPQKWSNQQIFGCAYGLHPAVLSYNGIATIDGYCGYYSQDYKEKFRDIIAPTLDKNDNIRKYYDEWGCRAYLFSEDGRNYYDFGANSESIPQKLLVDTEILKQNGCEYIFSRFEIINKDDVNLEFIKEYTDNDIPYSVFLYRIM